MLSMDDIKYIKRLHDEEAYLTEWKNIKEARRAIAAYIRKYNWLVASVTFLHTNKMSGVRAQMENLRSIFVPETGGKIPN